MSELLPVELSLREPRYVEDFSSLATVDLLYGARSPWHFLPSMEPVYVRLDYDDRLNYYDRLECHGISCLPRDQFMIDSITMIN